MARLFRKKYRWDADVVNELLSCRQFLGGQAPKDNEKFVVEVTNRAVRYTLRHHPFFQTISEIDGADRTYGKVVEVRITRENWTDISEKLDQMACMNESDLLQFCARYYVGVLKTRRALPEDFEYTLDETVAQIRP